MTPRYVRALIIYTGLISVTGLLASWMIGFERTEIKKKSSVNSFKTSSDAAQPETTTLASALAVTEGVSNTPKAQAFTDFLGTAPTKKMSGTSRASSATASAELSQQTTPETAALSAAGSVETTAGGTVTLSETIEEVKTPILPVTKQTESLETPKSTLSETVTARTEIKESTNVESSTNTAENTPKPESISVSHFKPTSETDFRKPTEAGITVTKQESGTITATANIKSASPIPEPMTDGATNFITSKLKTSKITSENKATAKTRPTVTFKTAAFITETKVDLTEGKSAPSTFIKMLKTAGTEPSEVETSETTTVRPQESTQAIKTSNGPTKINGATGINLLTMIQTAIGTKRKTVGKRLSTAGSGNTIKGRHRQEKTPLSHDKSLYSAITMGCILVICALLALIVFIKDFVGC